MKYQLDRRPPLVYSLHFHLVFVVKHCQKVLTSERIIDLLKSKISEISEQFEVEVLGIEPNRGHVYLLFKSKPTLDLPKYINAVNTITSREIRRIFPEVKDKLWRTAFWGRS